MRGGFGVSDIFKSGDTMRSLEENGSSSMRGGLWCRRLARKEELLRSLETLMARLGDGGEIEEFFQKLTAWSADLVDARKASLFLLDRSSGNLVLRTAHGDMPDLQIFSPVLLGKEWEKLLGAEGLCVPPAAELGGLESGPSGGWLVVPLVIRNQLLAVLLAERPPGIPFLRADLEALLSYARTAALALENNFLYRQIFQGMTETLQLLVSILEARDPDTKDHSLRVTRYALMMADRLGCSPEEREMLDFAGRLHDIGKVGIQDTVLLKPGRLNADEIENMRQHPALGEQIVRPVCLLAGERAVVRHHHEWWNGEGYPDHLSGREIPFLPRILSVADAFDAMTSHRPYRRALSPRRAMSILEEYAGVQFDGDIVRAFRVTEVGAMAAANAKHGGQSLDAFSPARPMSGPVH